MLRGRRRECETLDQMLTAVRAGRSGVLVIRGDPGIGKSALLEYLVERAAGCRLLRAAGVQAEMELAYAGLHQLVSPLLGRLDRLPGPQRDALGAAFGATSGAAPDRFLVGLAVLNLLSEASAERPLVAVLDDGQWLDRASAQALTFVGRRLHADSVLLVFAARDVDDDDELVGLPVLPVSGLPGREARALLGEVIQGPLDAHVVARIVAETRGNPLALQELTRGLTSGELAGGFGIPDAPLLVGRIEASFRRRFESLSADTRLMVLIAAADPLGDPMLVGGAALRLGIGLEALGPAEADGLLSVGTTVTFRHPLARSSVYRSAPPEARRTAHGALAEATDPDLDPDRRAWHRAHAAPGPDDDVAAELERSAGRAQARGGLAAAAAFRERAAALTADPVLRAKRSLEAAETRHLAGASGDALVMLATARLDHLDDLERARVDLLRARIAAAQRRSSEAPLLLLRAARALEPLDVGLSRDTYLDALAAGVLAGHLASPAGLLDIALAARAAPSAQLQPPRPADLMLDAMTVRTIDGFTAAAPLLKRALDAYRTVPAVEAQDLRSTWHAYRTALDLWDDDAWDEQSARNLEVAHRSGALTALPLALRARFGLLLRSGDYAAAVSVSEQMEALTEAGGSQVAPDIAMFLAAWRGREEDVLRIIDETTDELEVRGEGQWLSAARWARALLYNGLGRPREAVASTETSDIDPLEQTFMAWTLVELVEAATAAGESERATAALDRLTPFTRGAGTNWSLGVEARLRAMLDDGAAAERLYQESIERLGRTRMLVEVARTHLTYGESLRRWGRDLDARDQLREAHDMFVAMRADGFADRAARELAATGERVHRPATALPHELTAQETQIARLARDGETNHTIGAQLFISPRTVEWHLRKVFNKLGISSRRELAAALRAG
jgi:DNA-binding CsgD family transcriptional regulator